MKLINVMIFYKFYIVDLLYQFYTVHLMSSIITRIILVVVAIVVAVVVFPIISQQVALKNTNTQGTVTSTQNQLLQLVPTIFVIAIVGIPVAMLAITFKSKGD